MYNPNQNGTPHRYDYPYDPRTHSFASPAGMHYPAPNIHPLPLRPIHGEFYPEETQYQRYGQGSDGPRTERYDHQIVPYGPGDWAPNHRLGLGVSTIGHPELVPPQMAPHTSYHYGRPDHFDLPPIPNRSITLDSTGQSDRRYPHTPYSQAPARYQSSGTRIASPLSSQSYKKRHDPYSDRNGKPWPKARVGGPPKAPLGGIGGKPWDERINDRTVSSPLPSTSSGTPMRTASTVTEEIIPTYKGNPIIFKPPPSTYLPDEPELLATNLDSEGGERVPRKDVSPGPVQPPRGPPETIPLPPSPIDSDLERSGRRTWTSIDSTATMESSDGLRIKGKGKGKKVVVSLPSEAAWEEQNALVRKKARSQSIRDAVLLRPAPAVKAVQAGESGSSEESPETASKEAIEVEQPKSDPNTTPPLQPPTDDPLRVRSPPTPTRRGQSGTSQGSSAFVRRQLGGMLRSGLPNRMARATPSTSGIPESQSSKREGKDQANEKESGKGSESLKGVAGGHESTLVLGEGPTVASSAYLTRVTTASLGDRGGGSPTPRQDFEDVIFAPSASGKVKNEVSTQIPGSSQPIPSQENATRRQSETDTTNPSAKRLRPTAEPWVPNSRHSSGSSTTDARPKGKLRPTAAAFTPRVIASNSSSVHVPAGASDFTFRAENIRHRGMQSWSSMESDDRLIFGSDSLEPPTKQASIPVSSSVMKETSSQVGPNASEQIEESRSEGGNENVVDVPLPRSRSPSDVEHTSNYAASEPSNRSRWFGLDEMDIPTARPFSSAGVEQSFLTHQSPGTAHSSPAAELHGIFASPGHSSPLSEISDSMEVLSDSFDPVSYSYETDTESTYEVSSTAVFFTSTPRGGHRVLPLNSIHSDSESGRSSPEEYHTVPTVDVDQDPRRRFMEWTFPNGHGQMPSIYRRHTFDHLNLTHSDETSVSPEQGVASTFASRVGDLRAHLAKNQGGKDDEDNLRVTSGPSGMLSTRSSAEFPMRSPNKKVAVVNLAGEGQDQTPESKASPTDKVATSGWDEVALRHAELSGKLANILKALDSRSSPEVDLSPLTQMLEHQSTLISSLANATQQDRGHQHDHLIPLLEGQQAVLEKLTTVESTQMELRDRLAQFDEQQSEVVGGLRLQIEEITAGNDKLANRVHLLDIELLESRYAQETTQKEAGEDRDKLEIAQSRNAALEQHLQTLIKEKQCLVRDIEEDQRSRQERTSRFELAQSDLDAKQKELVAENRRNETLAEVIQSQASELAELRHSTSRFQETLVDRLSRIEEGVQGSSDHSAELAKLQARNERLQEAVDSLKEQHVLAQQERFAEETKSTATLRELEQLRQELSSERELRKNAEEKATTAEEALQKESVERFQAQMMAKERSHRANMQEVQLGARTRECNYWQTFALTYDRTAYRNYLKSKPFHGIEMGADGGSSNKGKAANAIPTYEELHVPREDSRSEEKGDGDGDDQQTPTKADKRKGKGVATMMDEDREAWSSRGE